MTEGIPIDARSSFPAGARCAHHPDRLAARTCVRCGNYMCEECISASSSGICLSCASRKGGSPAFPYSRDNYSFDGLLSLALSRWKQHWLPLGLGFAALLACIALSSGLRVLTSLGPPRDGAAQHVVFTLGAQLVGQLIMLGLMMVVLLALFGLCLDVLEGQVIGLRRSLERARALPALLLHLVMFYAGCLLVFAAGYLMYRLLLGVSSAKIIGLVIYGSTLVFLPFAIYAGLGLSFIVLELAHNPLATAVSALRTSWQMVAGRRWSVSGVLFVSGLISGIGFLACCVGVLASAPLGMLLHGALFLALKQPTASDAPPAGTHEWPV